MNESNDRMLADWLHEGPESGPREGLERALAATRRVGQRPGWTIPERWIPMQLTLTRTHSQRPILALVMLALLVVALVASVLVIGALRLRTPSLYRNGAVVYEQEGDLFIADHLDGTARPLVTGPDVDSDPVFSDQGDRVAFVRQASEGTTIMAVRPDGGDVTELATVPGSVQQLGWSPDGRALLASYFSRHEGRHTDVIASDGSGSRRLDFAGGHVIAAVWRPDSRQILFRRIVDPDDHLGYTTQGVYIADAEGTNVRELPIGDASGGPIAFSPDGRHISFVNGDAVGRQISIADIDEAGNVTGSRQLTHDPESSIYYSQWSPDGSKLAVAVDKGASGYLGVVDSDGSGFRAVGPEALGGYTFIWSPDGRSLVVREAPIENPDGSFGPRGKLWSVDVATGAQTEVQTPVESWQRLAP
jgi:dipeptidyl aminopeptidase/acylaminoacyl peptidase